MIGQHYPRTNPMRDIPKLSFSCTRRLLNCDCSNASLSMRITLFPSDHLMEPKPLTCVRPATYIYRCNGCGMCVCSLWCAVGRNHAWLSPCVCVVCRWPQRYHSFSLLKLRENKHSVPTVICCSPGAAVGPEMSVLTSTFLKEHVVELWVCCGGDLSYWNKEFTRDKRILQHLNEELPSVRKYVKFPHLHERIFRIRLSEEILSATKSE